MHTVFQKSQSWCDTVGHPAQVPLPWFMLQCRCHHVLSVHVFLMLDGELKTKSRHPSAVGCFCLLPIALTDRMLCPGKECLLPVADGDGSGGEDSLCGTFEAPELSVE